MKRLLLLGVLSMATGAAAASMTDAEYVEVFQEDFGEPSDTPDDLSLDALMADIDRFMGEVEPYVERELKGPLNDAGGIGWGVADKAITLNALYAATQNPKYLETNRRILLGVAASTDAAKGLKLWSGETSPTWSSSKYAPKRGRAVFPVHTGMIVYPMYEFAGFVRPDEALREKWGEDAARLLATADAAMAYHNRQWREGPAADEGHYIFMDQEVAQEGKPLPGNRLAALGRALWASWTTTGNEAHRDKARKIARYMKHRLTPTPQGAYTWEYWLPEERVTEPAEMRSLTGEDLSHGSLTMSFLLMMGQAGEVVTQEDLERLGQTVLQGFGRRADGVIFGRVNGEPITRPMRYARKPSAWLPLDTYVDGVAERILPYYAYYRLKRSFTETRQLAIFRMRSCMRSLLPASE